jgi:hypothetical protein
VHFLKTFYFEILKNSKILNILVVEEIPNAFSFSPFQIPLIPSTPFHP